ncbi:hypothetical protein Pfo_003631, partial [Paulownia fortunei]
KFGSVCYAQIPKVKRQKLDETSEKCIFAGYSSKSKGYRLYNLKNKSIMSSRDVIFDENTSWNWETSKIEKGAAFFDEKNQISARELEENEEFAPNTSGADFSSSNDPCSSSSTSSTPLKMRSLSDIYARCNFCTIEPKNFDETIK